MKFRNILAVAAVALLATSVAFGQGTTTTSTPCNGPAGSPTAVSCSVDGQTLLVASYQEGLTLTVPNQINFNLVPGMQNPGSEPLVAKTTWVLDPSYTNIWVDAFFKDAVNSMTASDPCTTTNPHTATSTCMGANIPANAILAQQNGHGGITAFSAPGTVAAPGILDPGDPIVASAVSNSDVQAAFPIKNISLTGTTTLAAGSGNFSGYFVGSDTSYLNLFIDYTAGSTLNTATGAIYPSSTGTWAGYVYVRAQAY